MKMPRLLSIILLGATLMAATPVYAQRGGGNSSRGGGSHSTSSRSFSSASGSSRSASSISSASRSSSQSSRSSVSHSRSGASHSSASGLSGRSFGTSSSNLSSNSESLSGLRSSGSASGISSASSRASVTPSRTGSVPTQTRRSQAESYSGSAATSRTDAARASSASGRPAGEATRGVNAQAGAGRPSGIAPTVGGGGPLPHHNPYHADPRYHQLYWDPCPPRHCYWPGFWIYCNSYWCDLHVSDSYAVHEYLKETYNMELVAYAISGNYMYALISDPNGHTYLQIYDNGDKLLAEQQVSRKYIKVEVDPENGGCWITKKRGKDALLFLYADGRLLIYEANK